MKRFTQFAVLVVLTMPLLTFGLYSLKSGNNSCPIHIDAGTTGQITRGISEADVVRILGAPAGNYSSGHVFVGSGGVFALPRSHVAVREWHTDEAQLSVYFDAQGLVVDSRVFAMKPIVPPTFLDRVRYWVSQVF